jgi:molybdopterin biosynthesis enzyme
VERKNRIYRHLKTLDEARRILQGRFGSLRVGTETIPVRDALGRVLAGPAAA